MRISPAPESKDSLKAFLPMLTTLGMLTPVSFDCPQNASSSMTSALERSRLSMRP